MGERWGERGSEWGDEEDGRVDEKEREALPTLVDIKSPPPYRQITYVKQQMNPVPIHVGLIVRISSHSFEK